MGITSATLGQKRDQYGNFLISAVWHEKDEKGRTIVRSKSQIIIDPQNKPVAQIRAEIAPFQGNVIAPDGYTFVCLHCGSRRSDKFGIGAYDDNDGEKYVWDETCIKNAILVSEDEYREGRRIYDAAVLP